MSGSALLGGLLAGLAAILAWAFVGWVRRRRRLKNDFGFLAGSYDVTRKQETDLEFESVHITVDGNILTVTFEGLADGGTAEGEIEMNEQLPRLGRGHYTHLKAGKLQLWGFWEIAVNKRDTILVHHTYSKAETKTEIVSGYLWTRQPSEGAR